MLIHPPIYSIHIYEVVMCSALVQWHSTLATGTMVLNLGGMLDTLERLKILTAGLPSPEDSDVTDPGVGLDTRTWRNFPDDCTMKTDVRAPKTALKTK